MVFALLLGCYLWGAPVSPLGRPVERAWPLPKPLSRRTASEMPYAWLCNLIPPLDGQGWPGPLGSRPIPWQCPCSGSAHTHTSHTNMIRRWIWSLKLIPLHRVAVGHYRHVPHGLKRVTSHIKITTFRPGVEKTFACLQQLPNPTMPVTSSAL